MATDSTTLLAACRAKLAQSHKCYRGCYHYERGGKLMHQNVAALERVLNEFEPLLSHSNELHRALGGRVIGIIADALRVGGEQSEQEEA